jgi:Uma2 family endonuclease
VRSPDDREVAIRRKTALYLEHGATMVLDVDPATRRVRLSTHGGERTLTGNATIGDLAFPGLIVPVAELFAPLDRLYGS